MVMTGGYASSWLILHVGMLFGQGAKNAGSLGLMLLFKELIID
ncbi:hypothetical protein [Bifidobacterium longum]